MKQYAAGLLAADAYPPFGAGIFLQTFENQYVTCGYSLDEQGLPNFAFAGTRDAQDAVDDACAIARMVSGLGHIHTGFMVGMEDMFDTHLRALCRGVASVSSEGHSLGCSHAAIFAGLSVRAGVKVSQLVMLEPPRPGYDDFAEFIRSNVPSIHAFRNARDFVVDWPERLPLLPWAHIAELIDLKNPASGINPIDDHLLASVLPGLLRWQQAQI